MRTDNEFLERADFERSRLIDKLADKFRSIRCRWAIRVKIIYNALAQHQIDYIASETIDDEEKHTSIAPFLLSWLDELGSFATRRQALLDSLHAGRMPDERWDTFIAEARQAGFDGMADDMEWRATHYREV